MEGAIHRKFRLGHSFAVFGIFLSFITLSLSSINAPKTIAFGTSEVATLSNQYRSNAGLQLLTTNGKLTSSAQAKVNHMATNNYFAHDAPDGTSPWYFFDQSGYSYTTAGENLALTNQSASSVVDGWYNSPGHRANMLSADFTEVGYGIAFVNSFTYNGSTYNNVYLVAAHYAKPVNATPAPPAAPPAVATPPAAPSAQSTPAPTVAPVQPVETVPSAPVEDIKAQEVDESVDHQPVSGSTDPNNGNTTSGTMAATTKEQPKLSTTLGYGGLGLGASFVVIGVAIETRRLLRHMPLIPHHK
jgi:hypothetical protein